MKSKIAAGQEGIEASTSRRRRRRHLRGHLRTIC